MQRRHSKGLRTGASIWQTAIKIAHPGETYSFDVLRSLLILGDLMLSLCWARAAFMMMKATAYPTLLSLRRCNAEGS